MDSFVVPMWGKIFKILSYISIYALITRFKKNISYRFIDWWVTSNLIFAFAASLIVYYWEYPFILYFFSIYGIVRIFEIFVYQINVLLFYEYHHKVKEPDEEYKIKSPTRLIILLFYNYAEIVCWFSAIVISCLSLNESLTHSWPYYIRLNFLCVITMSSDELLKEISCFSWFSMLAYYESVLGFIMTIILLARFIGLLPQTKSIDSI